MTRLGKSICQQHTVPACVRSLAVCAYGRWVNLTYAERQHTVHCGVECVCVCVCGGERSSDEIACTNTVRLGR